MDLADIVPLCRIQTGRAGTNGHKYYSLKGSGFTVQRSRLLRYSVTAHF